MKILMVDKYYFIKGGAERYFFELKKVLEAHGHEVIPFSMQHPENFDSDYADDFVSNIDFNGFSGPRLMLKAPGIVSRVIYSREARESVDALIKRVKPDIAHIHMIDHQLSASILHAFRDNNIPVVQTCHQYKLVCPSYRLFIMHKNEVCERCVTGDFYNAVLTRCHKQSLPASALVALESYIHKWMGIYDLIDVFHVPSRFLGEKLKQGGLPADKIWHHFYTIDLKDYPFQPKPGDAIVYYGRLSEEKGILTLLKAVARVDGARLKIIGDGPQRAELESYAAANRIENVEFAGTLGGEELVQAVQNARFVVVPSEWYDNSPLVIYESFSMGKPVVASTMGGMPELIEHNVDGLHFTAGDIDELAGHLHRLWNDPDLCEQMGRAGRDKAESMFSPEVHYEHILDLYERVVRREGMPIQPEAAVVDRPGES